MVKLEEATEWELKKELEKRKDLEEKLEAKEKLNWHREQIKEICNNKFHKESICEFCGANHTRGEECDETTHYLNR